MPYKLRNGLFACQVDSRYVFMDVRNDRYFMLPEPAARTLCAHVDGRHSDVTRAEDLLGGDLLIENKSFAVAPYHSVVEPPRFSAIENDGGKQTVSLRTSIEVFGIVCWTRLRLRLQSVEVILDKLAAHQHDITRHPSGDSDTSRCNLMNAARAFVHARRYVPVTSSCLLDSLSMIRFLARRRLPASLVFGVALDPFSAHCWVQADDVALSETVSDTSTYTPILVM